MGRILAHDIVADRDFPPFDRVTMDGIAMKYHSDHVLGQEFRVVSTQFAGDPQQVLDSDQEVIEIMTGAACPTGADSVVRYEDLMFKEEGTQSKLVRVMALPKKVGQNIHKKGSDRKKGDVLLPAGTLMGPPEIAVAATVGMSELSVIEAPRIAVISTGNELVEVEETPLPHQIRHSNVHTIQTALTRNPC